LKLYRVFWFWGGVFLVFFCPNYEAVCMSMSHSWCGTALGSC